MQQKYPYVQWVDYINAILPKKLSVDENEVIVVAVPSYFEKLAELLRNTPSRTIANYILWRVVSFSSSYLTTEVRDKQLIFNKALLGIQEQPARWKECTDTTRGR